MDSLPQLTVDGVKKLKQHDKGPITIQVWRIRPLKEINSGKYKALLWDKENGTPDCIFGPKLNAMVRSGTLSDFSVIQVTNYMTFKQETKDILLILEANIIRSDLTARIEPDSPEQQPQPQPQEQEDQQFQDGQQVENEDDVMLIEPQDVQVLERNENQEDDDDGAMQRVGEEEESSSPPKVPKPRPNFEPTHVRINDIHEYMPKYLEIKGRCTIKSPIKPFFTGTGNLFVANFMDDSSEIKMVFFNAHAFEHYQFIKVGKVYSVKFFDVKESNRTYTRLRHPCEIKATDETDITVIDDDNYDRYPDYEYKLVNLQKVAFEKKPNDFVDTMGVVLWSYEAEKSVFITDKTNHKMGVVLFDEQLEELKKETHPVILIRDGKVENFRNHNQINCRNPFSNIVIKPESPEAIQLRDSHFNRGDRRGVEMVGVTPWTKIKELGQLLTASAGGNRSEEEINGITWTNKVRIIAIENAFAMYKACPLCTKEVIEESNGDLMCSKCKIEVGQNFVWKCKLVVDIGDETGQVKVICFKEVAETLLGKPETELAVLYTQKPREFAALLRSKVIRPPEFYIFTCVYKNVPSGSRVTAPLIPHVVKKIEPFYSPCY